MNEKKEITFIEMFCGVGGFRLGFERANNFGGLLQGKEDEEIQDSPNNQKRKDRAKGNGLGQKKSKTQEDNGDIETKRHGFAWQSRIRFNCVWANDNDKYACQVYRKRFGDKELVEGDVRNIRANSIPEHDLLTAGFPCQAFSIAGKRKGFQDKTKGTLFYEICRVVRNKRPKYLLLENVKGLLSHEHGRTFAIILLSLDELGYDIEWQVLNTKYWLPQNRERVFIFGVRREGG